MAYIWQNPEWPSYSYDRIKVEKAYSAYLEKKKAVEAAFSILDKETVNQIHAKTVSEEIVSSLEIEGELISFDSVYSSVSKHLDIRLENEGKHSPYADSVSSVILDAIENREPLTKERLGFWNKKLFENQAGIRPKKSGSYRTGPEYIVKTTTRGPEVVYTAVPPERVEEEMEKLLDFINGENEKNMLIKSAIAAQWFVVIHPYADGNGRISRAISDYISCSSEESSLKTFSMSSIILSLRNEYYKRLNALSSQDKSLDLTDWIVWNINIATQAQDNAIEKLKRTVRVTKYIKGLDPSEYNSREIYMLYKLADGTFFGKLTTDKWAKMTKCSAAASHRDIQHLVNTGHLVPDGDKGPKTGYLFNQILFDSIR